MEIIQFRIGQFADGQSNSMMGGSVLKIDQGQVEVSVKLPKAEVKINKILETDARYTLTELAKITGNSSSKVDFFLNK